MTAEEHRNSIDINYSLDVLKKCFHAHAAIQRGEPRMLPFRECRLTRVLRDCFVDPSHKTAVIATVSPAASDVIHTVNTLRHAVILAEPLLRMESSCTMRLGLHFEGECTFWKMPVLEWTPAEVQEWLQVADDGRFSEAVVPPNLTGKDLLSSSARGLSELFAGALRKARVGDEGEAWTVPVDGRGEELGRAIIAAAHSMAMDQRGCR